VRTRLLSGLVFHLVPAASIQWEPATWLAVGGTVRSPALRLWSRGTFQGESQDTTAAGSRNTFLQTGSGEFDYRYPLELDAGVAFRQERWAVEVDARYHASSGSYQLLGTGSPVQSVTLPPGGAPAESPFTPVEYVGRAVLDLALGGTWAASGAVRLHAGVYMSPSPVAAGSSVFRQTDLYGARAGVSVRGQKLSGSVGLGYETGLSSASPNPAPGGAAAMDDRARLQRFSIVIAFEFET
jgi:hypothetical protein